jgi:hypothetical protein
MIFPCRFVWLRNVREKSLIVDDDMNKDGVLFDENY